jgi:membrane protein YqaA with SNARE-associated domain
MKLRVKDLLSLLGVAAAVFLSALMLLGTLSSNALLGDYGLVGIFVMALLSHLTIIARGLFLPSFLSLTQLHNPLPLGLAAGLGGGIGEMITYYWGLGIKKTLTSINSINERDDSLPKWAERYGLIVALLFASSPLPDTPIMLLAGALRFPPHKILMIQLAGKTILYSIGASIGGFIFMELKSATEEITASIIVLVASITLTIIISWSKSREKIIQIIRKARSHH